MRRGSGLNGEGPACKGEARSTESLEAAPIEGPGRPTPGLEVPRRVVMEGEGASHDAVGEAAAADDDDADDAAASGGLPGAWWLLTAALSTAWEDRREAASSECCGFLSC